MLWLVGKKKDSVVIEVGPIPDLLRNRLHFPFGSYLTMVSHLIPLGLGFLFQEGKVGRERQIY